LSIEHIWDVEDLIEEYESSSEDEDIRTENVYVDSSSDEEEEREEA
jgi:hypothetical protein